MLFNISNLNIQNTQPMLFNSQMFGNTALYNNSLFANLNMPIQSQPLNFFNMFSGFNFNFSNVNFGSVQTSTVVSGNKKASSKAEGLDKAFLNKVKQIADKIGCDYKDLLGIMHSESGLNSKAVNKSSNATGLIQFMPATAKNLGTTTEELKNMSALQQLDYVEKFLIKTKNASALKNKSKISSGDLYALIFMPAKSGNEIIAQAGSKAYSCNKGLDTNKDGIITKTELANKVVKHHVDESIFA